VADLVTSTRPDLVFHLASHVAGARDLALVAPMLRANLVAAVNLMTALAGTAPVPTVLAGSIEEPRVGEEPTPSSPYAAAKAAASRYALLFHSLYGLPVTTLRIAMVYGPGQPDATTSRSGLARHCSCCAGGTPGCE